MRGFEEGMEMLRAFWDPALELDPDAPDEARTLRFSRPGEIAGLLDDAGLIDIREATLTVSSDYRDFDELWDGLLAGIGLAGAYCVALPDDHRSELRETLRRGLGTPPGAFTLRALARSATAVRPATD